MKWDCDARHDRLTQWHRWFAWYPAKVGPNDCRWLEYVQRRGEWVFESYRWEYK